MDTFKFPVRFRGGGVEKLQDGTDEFYAHLIALSLQIHPTELRLNPQFGVEDATFNETLTRDLAFTAGAFIPEIIIEKATIALGESGKATINISFKQRD